MEESRRAPPRPLRDRLRDDDAALRRGAAGEAFASKASPSPFRAELSPLLSDPDAGTRIFATRALGRIGPDAFGDLARALDAAQPPAVRAAACRAAGAHGPAAGTLAAAVSSCILAPDEKLRAAAWIAAWRIGVPSVPHLVRILERRDGAGPLVAAANAAGAIGRDAAATEEALRRASSHPDGHVALACADALGRVTGKPADALPALVAATRSTDGGIREEAVRRIGALRQGGHGAAGALLERTEDPLPKVRAASAVALALVGASGNPVHEAFGRLLEDPESEVRVAAAAGAGQAKDVGRPLLPQLGRLRAHPERRTATAARAACEALEGKDRPARARAPRT